MAQGEQAEIKSRNSTYEVQGSWSSAQLLQAQASLIELAHDAILIRDPESHIIFWNRGAEELYGWASEVAVGQITHDLLQTQFPESLATVTANLESRGEWEGELLHTCANGIQITVESRQVLKRDESGQPFIILEVNRDITARKADLARISREADLQEQRSRGLIKQSALRLRLAQRAGNIGTFEWDIVHKNMLWTPELKALYGLPPGESVGTYEAWTQRIHPDDLARVEENLRQASAGESTYDIEFRVIWPDETIHWLLAKGEVVSSGDDSKLQQLIGVNVDITRLKEVEQALQNLNANLEERVVERTLSWQQLTRDLQRSNQELQDFAYVASHDLQEPLRKIQAFGNLLQEEYGPVLGEGNDYIERMRHAATRMRILIDDLLAFSRVTTHALPFVSVDLNTIVAEVVIDLEVQIQTLQGKVEIEHLPIIEGDAMQMRQLLQNLLGNALKFHRRDVPPIVKVWAEPFVVPTDLSDSGEAQSWFRLFVADNGIGFDEKYLDRIFTIFQRLHGKSTYEGTGIGLAVVRKIAERHGGTVTAESNREQGSTFIVTLPVQRASKEENADGK